MSQTTRSLSNLATTVDGDDKGNTVDDIGPIIISADTIANAIAASKEELDGDDGPVLVDWLDEDDEDWIEVLDEDEEFDETLSPILLDKNFTNVTNDMLLAVVESNVSYFYLKNELGLSEGDMWRITFEAPSALGMTTDTIRRKINVLSDTMNLSKPEIRILLQKFPTLLHLSADSNLAPKILFLLRLLDFSRQELKDMILACPSILGYNKQNLKSKVGFFTNLMGYSQDETRTLLLKEPNLWRASVKTGLIPHMRFLIRDMQIPRNVLAHKIVAVNPRILLYSLDQNIIPKLIFYGIMTLQMDLKHVQKLLATYPQFMNYNLDRHILPITRYFLKDLEFSPTEFRSMLLAYPRIITHALTKIKYMVGFLRYEVGLSGTQVKRVLYQAPQVLGMKDSTIREKIDFLKQTFDLSDHHTKSDEYYSYNNNDSPQVKGELQTVIAGMPRLLVLNVHSNLKPKVLYLRQAFNGDQAVLRAAVVRSPTLLAYSLKNRIQPRMQALLEEPALDPGLITWAICLKDDKFQEWLVKRKRKIRQQREKQAQEDVEMVAESNRLALPDEVVDVAVDPSGPIVHWTRPRRPRGG